MSALSNQTTLTTRAPVAITGRSGKVSKTAEKAHRLVSRASSAAILGMAINGKGIMGKTAKTAVPVLTLDMLLYRDKLDGGAWGDMLNLLVQQLNITPSEGVCGMKARPACLAYLQHARAELVAKFESALGDVKAQGRAYNALQKLDAIAPEVQRLNDAHEAAAMEARALAQAGLDAAPESAGVEELVPLVPGAPVFDERSAPGAGEGAELPPVTDEDSLVQAPAFDPVREIETRAMA